LCVEFFAISTLKLPFSYEKNREKGTKLFRCFGSALFDDFSQRKLEAVASHHPAINVGLRKFIHFAS
jgi:hypothetical protein